uniref:MYND-type domain-containing protein n=1 Tax=Anopheles epiroticus TaxID=199890 RepID=A0A182P4Z7_9DIPT
MLRPEVVERLDCPIVGLATSWSIGRKGVPLDNLEAVRTLFERKFWPFPKGKIRKSNSRASSLRELGNATYKKAPNEPGKALELYNQSICMAEEGSTDLGLAYANRSAVYFNRKLYRECLDNIALARNHNYPSQMMSKLVEREKRAKQFLENDVDNSSPSESSTTTKNSTIKSFLALSEDRRCLITTRYMEAGEKVLLEKPFVLVVEPELAYQRCDYCAATKKHSLIPCKGCTAVMYCNEECQAQAFQRYHQFECEIVDDLHLLFRGPKATRMFHVILRLFWQAILLLLEDPKKFLKCVAPAERESPRDSSGGECFALVAT